MAMRLGDLPPAPTGMDARASWPGPPGDGPPDSLVLLFASIPQSCASPELGLACPDPLVWQSALIVPPDLVRVGAVDLGNPRIQQFRWYYQTTGSDTACESGVILFGTNPGGTLEILATGTTSLSIKLSGGVVGYEVPGATPSVILDGTYTVPWCGTAPPTPQPSAGVAIRGSSLPADLPSNPTIGTTVDPTALYVFIGTGTQTCADPLSALPCNGDARLVLKIPATLQQTGTLDLSDSELAGSVAISANSGSANCTTGVGTKLTQGTIDIVSLDASAISLSLYQSHVSTSNGATDDLDGLYQATICP